MGRINHQFDRKLNNCEEVEQPGEPIYIGMDFNVGKMAGIVHVLRLGLPCAVTEIINAYDTPDMIRIIKERFWLYDGNDYRKVREIYIYPDASGDSRKSSNASTTDIDGLKLLVASSDNDQYRSRNALIRRHIEKMDASLHVGTKEFDISKVSEVDSVDDLLIDNAARYLLKDWKGVGELVNGVEVALEYTAERGIALLKQNPELYWQILAEAASIAQGKEQQKQDTIKKP